MKAEERNSADQIDCLSPGNFKSESVPLELDAPLENMTQKKSLSRGDIKAKELKESMDELLKDPEVFFENNNVLRFPAYSPMFKFQTQKIEKKFEMIEGMMRRWSKMLKQIKADCVAYIKSTEALANQLCIDKMYFSDNKELQDILALLAQFLKENNIYMDVFSKILQTSVYEYLNHN